MIWHHISHICILRICETKYQWNLVWIFVIIPEFICLYKWYDRAIFIHLIRQICRRDAEDDSFLIQNLLCRIEDLFHCPIVIQKIGFLGICNISYAEKLFDRVAVCLILFSFAAYPVLQLYRHTGTVQFLDAPAFSLFYLWFQTAPCDLFIIRINRHVLKCGVVRIISRFKRCSDACIFHLAKCIFMIIADVIQAFCNMCIFITDDTSIEIYRIRTISVQADFQDPLFIQYFFPAQIQGKSFSHLFNLLMFQLACTVHRIDFVAGSREFIPICFYVYIQALVRYRCDRVVHRGYIHAFCITCQCIDLIFSIRKWYLWKCCGSHIGRHIVIPLICHVAEYNDSYDKYCSQDSCIL